MSEKSPSFWGRISLNPGTNIPVPGYRKKIQKKKIRKKKKRENVFFQSVITSVEIRFRTKTKSRKSYLDEINNLASSPGKQGPLRHFVPGYRENASYSMHILTFSRSCVCMHATAMGYGLR